ncbi:MAG: TatD family hydrolase [Cecembia sp.]
MALLDIHTHGMGNPSGIFNGFPAETGQSQPFSLGIHPWYLKENWNQEISEIEQHSEDSNLYAIGECGFDSIKGPGEKLQLEAFTAQAQIAKKYRLPVILHCVKGLHLLQQFLKEDKNPPVIIWHGFNQKVAIGQSLLPFPVHFSFGEALFREGSNAQKWLKECPMDRIFFETDTSEKNISSIYELASLILGLPVQTLDRQVKENWKKISKRRIDE